MKESWYFKLFDKNKRIFYLSGEVNEESISELCFNLLCLLADDDEKEEKEKNFKRNPIKFYIQSHGGECDDMWTLIDIMLNSKTPIHTYCTGYAMSAGFKIFLAGEKRFISKHARLMYHQLSSYICGKYQVMDEDLQELEIIQDQIESYVLSRTKFTKKDLKKIRENKTEYYIRADEAIKLGIAHEVIK